MRLSRKPSPFCWHWVSSGGQAHRLAIGTVCRWRRSTEEATWQIISSRLSPAVWYTRTSIVRGLAGPGWRLVKSRLTEPELLSGRRLLDGSSGSVMTAASNREGSGLTVDETSGQEPHPESRKAADAKRDMHGRGKRLIITAQLASKPYAHAVGCGSRMNGRDQKTCDALNLCACVRMLTRDASGRPAGPDSYRQVFTGPTLRPASYIRRL